MPQANKIRIVSADRPLDPPVLVCPTCGRDLMNFAPHPAHPDMTIAYCVCNSIGPVLEYPTARPPEEHTKPAPPQAGEPPSTGV